MLIQDLLFISRLFSLKISDDLYIFKKKSIPIDIEMYEEQAGWFQTTRIPDESMRSCRKAEDENADAWLAKPTSTRKPAKKATHEQRRRQQ
jgi:hypothetical protein